MPSKGLSIMEGIASMFSSGARQGASTKPKSKSEQPLVERMVRQSDDERRQKVAKSIAKAFGQ